MAQKTSEIDEAFELNDPKGCVASVERAIPKVVNLTYPAICALLHASRSATSSHNIFGSLIGVNVQESLVITDVLHRPPLSFDEEGEDDTYRYDDQEERRKRELQLYASDMEKYISMYNEEMLDTYVVGQFVAASARFNPYSSRTMAKLVEQRLEGLPAVLLTYDPFKTSLLGRPCIRAFTPTEAYLKYVDLIKKEKGNPRRRSTAAAAKESGITKQGVLSEIPVSLEVDAYHTLGLAKMQLSPLMDSFHSLHSNAVSNYIETLLSSIRSNTDQLRSILDAESNMKDNANMPLAQKADTLLLMKHLQEQTEHLDALCDSALLNSIMIRDL